MKTIFTILLLLSLPITLCKAETATTSSNIRDILRTSPTATQPTSEAPTSTASTIKEIKSSLAQHRFAPVLHVSKTYQTPAERAEAQTAEAEQAAAAGKASSEAAYRATVEAAKKSGMPGSAEPTSPETAYKATTEAAKKSGMLGSALGSTQE